MDDDAVPPSRGRPALWIFALGIVALLAVVAGAIVVAFHNTAGLAVLRSTAKGLGYDVSAGTFDFNLSRASIHALRVTNAAGEPVLDAHDVRVAYSLRDLLPGGKRLFGLQSVEVTAPHVTVIHHRDGSYNITLPKSAAASPQPSPAPLNVRLRVSDGSVDLIDRFVRAPAQRRQRISDIHAEGDISPASGSYYHAGAELEDGSRRYPIRGNARFDDPRGFEIQHWTAVELPIAALANFALNSHAIVVEAGRLRDLDLKLGALATPAHGMQAHLGATARLTDGTVATSALTQPVRAARGRFVVDDDSVSVRSLDAGLGGIALHVSGALYHFTAPQVAFGLTARGDLGQASILAKDSAKLPIGGAIRVHGFAEGPATNPLIFARADAPHLAYAAYRIDATRGFIALAGKELDLIDGGVRYGPVVAQARAAILLQSHTATRGYATLELPTTGIPYAANLLPGVVLHGLAAVNGRDARLAARGYLAGANGPDRLDAPFALAADGSGDVGPVVLERRDGASVYARAALDAGRRHTVVLADIHALSLLPAPAGALPGFAPPALPANLDAKLDATLTASAAGTSVTSASGSLHGYGGWGDIHADADGSSRGLAARGRLQSSFERLAAFTGNIGARGAIDVPFAVTSAGSTTVLQIENARFPGGQIRGIALQGADATLALAGRAIDLYAADLRVAGHDVTAAGSFGNGGHIHVTAGDLDPGLAQSARVPLSGGRATVIADIGGTYARPTAAVLAALSGARYGGTGVGGDLGVAYDGATLRIDRATLVYGTAYARASGAVGGLTLGRLAPRYDLGAQLDDADIAVLAHTVKNPLRYPAGTLSARLHIGGSGAAPAVTGDVQIPEGSLNGLYLSGARVGIAADASEVSATGGQVTVGSTKIRFGGRATQSEQQGDLRAPAIDLADFNDYFDEADVLAGRGGLTLAFAASPHALRATADIGLRNTRYRRFALGAIDAHVRTAGTAVNVRGGIDGPNGRIATAGSINVAASDPLRDIARRSYLDLSTRVSGVDLGNVLPAAGLNIPFLGIVDGSGVVRGRYPALALSIQGALTHGVAGRVPIDRLTIAASAANGRGRISDATLVASTLSASLAGTFGLRPDDPFDLRAQAASPDINGLISTATGKNPGVRGTFATTAQLTGTIARPRLASSFDLRGLTYRTIVVPSVHADIAATRSLVDIRNGMVALGAGTIAFDGTVPLGGAIASVPLAFDFVPQRIDIAPYASLLPSGSVVAGIFNGNVGLRGTPRAPLLSGSLDFSGGAYRSPLLTSGLTDMRLTLDFAGTTVRIAALHARAAPGSIDGTGTLAVRDLRDPIRGASADVGVKISGARFAAPKYYTGFIDGTLTAVKRAGAPLTVGGDLAFTSARIPYTALLPSGGSGGSGGPALPDVAFDLGVTVGRDVRVQSGPVDIGTTGTARLRGTLATPTLDGQFGATDGSVSLYRTFTVQNGSTVSFNPSDGITPTVDATATTSISDPPTDVLMHVTGPSTHLNLDFSSEPAYSKEQILGLLVNAQALGAVAGVAPTTGGSTAGGVSLNGIGSGVLAGQFTDRFLQPFSNALGGALGLSDLNLNYNANGAVAAQARRRIGKNITFISGASFGGRMPQTSFGIRVGDSITSAQLTLYQATGTQQAFGSQYLTPFLQSGALNNSTPNYALESITPPTGSGFVFSYQRHFW